MMSAVVQHDAAAAPAARSSTAATPAASSSTTAAIHDAVAHDASALGAHTPTPADSPASGADSAPGEVGMNNDEAQKGGKPAPSWMYDIDGQPANVFACAFKQDTIFPYPIKHVRCVSCLIFHLGRVR